MGEGLFFSSIYKSAEDGGVAGVEGGEFFRVPLDAEGEFVGSDFDSFDYTVGAGCAYAYAIAKPVAHALMVDGVYVKLCAADY